MVIHVYILFIIVNITSCLEQCVKNCLRILRYCLCLRMIVAFYFSERVGNPYDGYCLYSKHIPSADTVLFLILVVPTLSTGACRG